MAGQSTTKNITVTVTTNQCPPLAPFLEEIKNSNKVILFRKKQKIFSQGEFADSLYYIQHGMVKLTVLARGGKEAVLALLGPGSFVGEVCLMDSARHVNTATALTDCTVVRVSKPCLAEALRRPGRTSELLLVHLLTRTHEYEQAICAHIVESSERRLARVLLRLCRCVQCSETGASILPKLSHETLAEMIGTTRPRVSSFMKKFEKLGLIEYKDGLRVHCAHLQAAILGEH